MGAWSRALLFLAMASFSGARGAASDVHMEEAQDLRRSKDDREAVVRENGEVDPRIAEAPKGDRTHARSFRDGFTPTKDAAQSTCEEIPELVLSTQELAIFDSFRVAATKLTVLGQLPGSSPGFAALREWAKASLHESFKACALIGNGFFEVSFHTEEGAQHALSRAFFFDGREVPFSPWNPNFSPENPASSLTLEFPVWIQFLGLALPYRNESCITILGSKYGRVLFFEDSLSYAGRTSGLRVKVLVKDSTVIPERIRLRGDTPGVFTEHKVLVTGHPNQCARCGKLGQNSKNCTDTVLDPLKNRNTSQPRKENRVQERRSSPPRGRPRGFPRDRNRSQDRRDQISPRRRDQVSPRGRDQSNIRSNGIGNNAARQKGSKKKTSVRPWKTH